MDCIANYQSSLFASIPPKSGNLALLLSEQSCSLAVTTSTGVLALLKKYVSSNVEQSSSDLYRAAFKENQSLFAKQFHTTSVLVQNKFFTLIPSELYNRDNNRNYLDFVLDDTSEMAIEQNEIKTIDAHLVFGIDLGIQQLLNQTVPSYHLSHSTAIGLDHVSNNSDVVIVKDESHFDCYSYNNGVLSSCNRFEYSNLDDIIYYILLHLKEMDVEPNTATVSIWNSQAVTKSELTAIERFVKTVEVDQNLSGIKTKDDFDGKSRYHFYLFNQLNASS